MTGKEEFKNYFKENYFIIIPIVITFLLYLVSLSYGFRNFDEDLIIKNFHTNKTFSEYIEKYLLVDISGITKAQGAAFSSIQNVHFCILERPVFYLINFLFRCNPFLFHTWSLFLHLTVTFFITKYLLKLSNNKLIALFSGLLWAIHPTNTELVIWATSWPNLLGAVFYFYTLTKVADLSSNSKNLNQSLPALIFISVLTMVQILLQEYTITIPLAIFMTVIFKTTDLKSAFKISFPSFLVVIFYWVLRSICTEKINTPNFIERIIYLTPQTFFHELALIIFPKNLSIDELDLLTLDKNFMGGYHIFCIICLSLFLYSIFYFRKNLKDLSFGCFLYLIGILPFLQIIPLYSVVAERYNYFGAVFLIFGIVSAIFTILKNKNKIIIPILIILSILYGTRTYFRIIDWKDSSTLFLSTINTSKLLLKKGIWTYNLAISQKDETKKTELLNLSNNLLNLFLNTPQEIGNLDILKNYGLDEKSLFAKAALRISTNHEILGNKELQYNYLLKALKYASNNSEIQSLIYKNLGTYYFQQNDMNKAVEYYKKNYFISPSPTIDFALAVCYLKLNDLTGYEHYLKKAVSVISAYNVSPFKTYGNFLEVVKHDYENAIKYYKIATLLENSPEPYILLGSLYDRLGQKDNALKYINRGLYSFPENPILISLKAKVKS